MTEWTGRGGEDSRSSFGGISRESVPAFLPRMYLPNQVRQGYSCMYRCEVADEP